MVRGIPGVIDPGLYSEQFSDWLGPVGSFGDPGPVGVGYDGSGISTGVGDIYGA